MASVARSAARNSGSVFLGATFAAPHVAAWHLVTWLAFPLKETSGNPRGLSHRNTLAEMWSVNWVQCHP